MSIHFRSFIACTSLAASFLICSAPVFASEPMTMALGCTYQNEMEGNDNVSLVTSQWPGFFLVGDAAAEYPQLNDALKLYNQELSTSMKESLADIRAAAVERFNQIKGSDGFDPATGWNNYTTEAEGSIRRADDKVLSLMLYSYSYTGGAHGNYGYTGKNFDSQTGKLLSIDDVITGREALKAAVTQQLERYYPYILEGGTELLDQALPVENEPSFDWTMDYNGLTLYFDPYTLGPYAAGAQIVTLSFTDYPDLIRSDYCSSCKDYGVSLLQNTPFYTDLEGDGTVERIEISSMPDSDSYSFNGLTILINDDRYEFPDQYFFSMRPTFLHTADGRSLVYAEITAENDYRTILIYDLSNKQAEYIGCFNGGSHNFYPMFEGYIACQSYTTPNCLLLDSRYDMLGTSSCCNFYTVGADGLPVAQWDSYQICFPQKLTLKTPLTVAVADETNNQTSDSVLLEKGTVLTTEQTDLHTWTDLRSEDGHLYRVYVNCDQWPHTIDGTDINDIFDDMIFAG